MKKFFKIINCLSPSPVQASPLTLFGSSLDKNLNWAEFNVEDKTMVSKCKNRVDIIDKGDHRLLQLIKSCSNLYNWLLELKASFENTDVFF
jgi:hypothetical protein